MNDYTTENTDTATTSEVQRFKNARNPKWVGLFLLAVGVILLAKQLGVVFPDWFFTWPVLLIAVGLFIGVQHGFKNRGWIIPTLIGTVFLIDNLTPGLNIKNYIWPMVIIAIGLLFIFRPKTNRQWDAWKHHDWRGGDLGREYQNLGSEYANMPASYDTGDFIDTTAVFGSIKKIILSKNFKGGDITNFMGGTEINLSQADITGPITIDATNIFGGTKLIVPPTWNVHSEVVAIFGGVDDKRQFIGVTLDPNKVIRLDGTCLFGGIEIKSF